MSYYVYAYLDPTNPTKEYLDIGFEYMPFYIGKGSRNRLYYHIEEAKFSNFTSYKCNKIRKLLNQDIEPIIVTIKSNLEESDALNLEKDLINRIGFVEGKNYNCKVGPLTNLIPGGGNPPKPIKGKFHTSKASEDGTHWWYGNSNPSCNRDMTGDNNPMSKYKHSPDHWWNGTNNPIHTRHANGEGYGNRHHNRNRNNQLRLDNLLEVNSKFEILLTDKLAHELGFKKRQNLYNSCISRIMYKELKGRQVKKIRRIGSKRYDYYLTNTGNDENFYKSRSSVFVVVDDIC